MICSSISTAPSCYTLTHTSAVRSFANDFGPVLFMYLGRRGSLGRFAYEIAEAARESPPLGARFVLSSSNVVAEDLRYLGSYLLEIDTFDRASSPKLITSFLAARRRLLAWLNQKHPKAVINLMPHVWTPLLRSEIQKLGIPYVTVIHDVTGHYGDSTGYITRWLTSEARKADIVITLSRSVADRLIAGGYADHERVRTALSSRSDLRLKTRH